MAYSTSNPPVLLSGFNDQNGRIWQYKSADAAATVDTAGYISNGDDLGMLVGDLVVVHDTGTPAVTLHAVQSVTAGGAVDLFDAGSTISTDTD